MTKMGSMSVFPNVTAGKTTNFGDHQVCHKQKLQQGLIKNRTHGHFWY